MAYATSNKIISGLVTTVSVVVIVFTLIWFEMNGRAREKYFEAEKLLEESVALKNEGKEMESEARFQIAMETFAEVISMHYAPFCGWIRKAKNKLLQFAREFEQNSNIERSIAIYNCYLDSFPPLPYQPFRKEREEIKSRVAKLEASLHP